MKSILAVLLILVMTIFMSTIPVSAEGYSNIPSNWALDNVKTMKYYELAMSEFFEAYDKAVSREEMAALIVKAYEYCTKETLAIPEITFVDTANSLYKVEIEKARTLGFIDGVGNNKYNPKDTLQRQQACKIIYNFILKVLNISEQQVEGELNFVDANIIADWAKQPAIYCIQNGIVNGVGNNKMDPLGILTREQILAILCRFLINNDFIGTLDATQLSVINVKKVEPMGITPVVGNVPWYVAEYEGWIYYRSIKNGVYKMKPDGTELTLVTTDKAQHIRIVDGLMYYGIGNENLFQSFGTVFMKDFKGNTLNEFQGGSTYNYSIINGEIYTKEPDGIFKINIATGEKTILVDVNYPRVVFGKDSIIYTSEMEDIGIKRASYSGDDLGTITKEKAFSLYIYNNVLYYSNIGDTSRIYRIDLDGDNKIKSSSKQNSSVIGITGEFVYYLYFENVRAATGVLRKMNLEGTGDTSFSSIPMSSAYVLGQWVYYYDGSKGVIGRVSLDGEISEILE